MKAVIVLNEMPSSCWGYDAVDLKWVGVDQYLDRCYAWCIASGRKDVKQYSLLDSGGEKNINPTGVRRDR